ncbi:hypothetical protein YC2023_081883 [Brassica napus]
MEFFGASFFSYRNVLSIYILMHEIIGSEVTNTRSLKIIIVQVVAFIIIIFGRALSNLQVDQAEVRLEDDLVIFFLYEFEICSKRLYGIQCQGDMVYTSQIIFPTLDVPYFAYSSPCQPKTKSDLRPKPLGHIRRALKESRNRRTKLRTRVNKKIRLVYENGSNRDYLRKALNSLSLCMPNVYVEPGYQMHCIE